MQQKSAARQLQYIISNFKIINFILMASIHLTVNINLSYSWQKNKNYFWTAINKNVFFLIRNKDQHFELPQFLRLGNLIITGTRYQ